MRKQCKRKMYAVVNPIEFVMEGIKPISNQKADKLLMRELSSLDAMSKGMGTLQEWTDINQVLTLCETMAINGVGIEALRACETLQEDLILSAKRFEATGRMGMTAVGLNAARDVIEYHHMQRTAVTLIEYEKAIRLAFQRGQSKAPGVVEI